MYSIEELPEEQVSGLPVSNNILIEEVTEPELESLFTDEPELESLLPDIQSSEGLLDTLKRLVGDDTINKLTKDRDVQNLLKSNNPNRMETFKKIVNKLPMKERKEIAKVLQKKPKVKQEGNQKFDLVTKSRKVTTVTGTVDESKLTTFVNKEGKTFLFIQEDKKRGKNRLASKIIGCDVYGDVKIMK